MPTQRYCSSWRCVARSFWRCRICATQDQIPQGKASCYPLWARRQVWEYQAGSSHGGRRVSWLIYLLRVMPAPAPQSDNMWAPDLSLLQRSLQCYGPYPGCSMIPSWPRTVWRLPVWAGAQKQMWVENTEEFWGGTLAPWLTLTAFTLVIWCTGQSFPWRRWCLLYAKEGSIQMHQEVNIGRLRCPCVVPQGQQISKDRGWSLWLQRWTLRRTYSSKRTGSICQEGRRVGSGSSRSGAGRWWVYWNQQLQRIWVLGVGDEFVVGWWRPTIARAASHKIARWQAKPWPDEKWFQHPSSKIIHAAPVRDPEATQISMCGRITN